MGAETRARILKLLRGGALCVGALASRTGITQSAVSQHLRVLRDAGLVVARRSGQFVHYSIDEEKVRGCMEALESLLQPPESPAGCRPDTDEGEGRCAYLNRSARSPRT
jgi:DNA-binding transcriptional ArsR family regulator